MVTNEITKSCENWILDTTCTFRMSSNRDWFSTYKTLFIGDMLMRNNSCKIIGIETIKIKIFDGIVRTLIDVKYDLDLKRNLISLSTINLNMYKYIGEGGVIKISKDMLRQILFVKKFV